MKPFTFFLLLLSAVEAHSQTPAFASSKIISLEKIPAVDSLCAIQVITIDMADQSALGNAVVLFTKSRERTMLGVVTTLEGNAERRLKPGRYDLEVRFTGKQTFVQERLYFEKGYRYMIRVGMADNLR